MNPDTFKLVVVLNEYGEVEDILATDTSDDSSVRIPTYELESVYQGHSGLNTVRVTLPAAFVRYEEVKED